MDPHYSSPTRSHLGGGAITALEIETAERDWQALTLRSQGLTYDQIGIAMGIAKSGAHAAVQRAMARTMQDAGQAARSVELHRLDIILLRWMPILMDTTLPGVLEKATNAVLKVMERRAKLLGLDQAPQVDATTRILVLAREQGYDEQQALEAARRILRETRGDPSVAGLDQDGE